MARIINVREHYRSRPQRRAKTPRRRTPRRKKRYIGL